MNGGDFPLNKPVTLLLLAALGTLVAGCQPQPTTAVAFGAQLFADPLFAESQFNEFSCATCHQTSAQSDLQRIDSGYSLYNSAHRRRFWGGQVLRLIEAVSFCYVYFMRGPGPLDPDDPKSKALYEYLLSISPDTNAPALPLTIIQDIVDVPRGDAARGREVYRGACELCHGEVHTGKGRMTVLAPVLPNVKESYPAQFPGVDPSLVFIEKVRHGQFFGVGGTMPLYSQQALSDEDLGALLSYLNL